MGDLNTDIEVLKDWRTTTVDPVLTDHGKRIGVIETGMNRFDGSLTVIKWLVGINVALMTALLVALFTWGLSHITLKVEATPQTTIGNTQPAENAHIQHM